MSSLTMGEMELQTTRRYYLRTAVKTKFRFRVSIAIESKPNPNTMFRSSVVCCSTLI